MDTPGMAEPPKKPEGSVDEYRRRRDRLIKEDSGLNWDRSARKSASNEEKYAAKIIWSARKHDYEQFFRNVPSENRPAPGAYEMGGQFLTNKAVIEESKIYKIAKRMPKGALLHLHFNQQLPVKELLDRCKDMNIMFIRSKKCLSENELPDDTQLEFQVHSNPPVPGNIFAREYKDNLGADEFGSWMSWMKFKGSFNSVVGGDGAEWVRDRLVFNAKEVYSEDQTTNGIWARFNEATRCFKGLHSYEGCLRWYVGRCIDSMISDRIMYAELRPTFMGNSIAADDGLAKLPVGNQMEIIFDTIEEKKADLKANEKLQKFPFGLKIVYCVPRSFPVEKVHEEINVCINLKKGIWVGDKTKRIETIEKRKKIGELICGFDFVGTEDRGNSEDHQKTLLYFKKRCDEEGVEIPFMFHAGETLLDTSGTADVRNSNLYDAVLFKARRVGHGYSLPKHPELMDLFAKHKICVELCPISNELLHLCRNIKGHVFPQLLAAGIPCTLNTDNSAFFGNSLSHEFYQVMVGWQAMSLHGWKQLAEWSIEYSRLSKEQRSQAKDIFESEWQEFCQWIIRTYKDESWVDLKLSPGGCEASISGFKSTLRWVKRLKIC